MNIVWAALGGLACGALFCIAGFVLGGLYAELSNMSNMEGARGYFAVAMGLIGAIVGMPVGTILTLRRRRGRTGAGSLVVGSLSSMAAIVALGVLGVGIWWMTQPKILGQNGPTPLLNFEVMPSEAAKAIDINRVKVELQTDRNGADGVWKRDDTREENGRTVLKGSVPLYYKTSQRMLVIKVPDADAQIFRLRLPSDPTGIRHRSWSEWHTADFMDDRKASSQPVRAVPERSFSVRYQVETAD